MITNTITAQAALAIPSTSLPSCRFADDSGWAADAWRVLREMAETGESARELCGTELIFSYTGGYEARVIATVEVAS